MSTLLSLLDKEEKEEEVANKEKEQALPSSFPLLPPCAMRPYLLKGHSRPLTQLKCVLLC
jgi:hypothetical protein